MTRLEKGMQKVKHPKGRKGMDGWREGRESGKRLERVNGVSRPMRGRERVVIKIRLDSELETERVRVRERWR